MLLHLAWLIQSMLTTPPRSKAAVDDRVLRNIAIPPKDTHMRIA